jgi:hypothetical protein
VKIAGIGHFGIAYDAGFVDFLAGEADVGGARFTVLLWNSEIAGA